MPQKRREIGTGERIDIPASECYLHPATGLPEYVKDRKHWRQGWLTVQEFAGFQVSSGSGQKRTVWRCLCDCGRFTNIRLGSQGTQSCGCGHNLPRINQGSKPKKKSGDTKKKSKAERKADMAKYKVLVAWRYHRKLCYGNSKNHGYANHGKLGIKMCDRWVNNFPAYLEDVGLPPTLTHVLYLIDDKKDFEPGNMRWYPLQEHQDRLHARRMLLQEAGLLNKAKRSKKAGLLKKAKHSKKPSKRKTLARRKIGEGARIDIPASQCDLEVFSGLPYMVRDKRGDRSGKLTILDFAGFQVGGGEGGKAKTVWRCVCDCGNFINIRLGSRNSARSCGCIHNLPRKVHDTDRKTTSLTERKVYEDWQTRRDVCHNPKAFLYPLYDGRGIKMCDRWLHNFSTFLEDVGLPPTLEHVLCRLDYSKGFEPDNMRWLSAEEYQVQVTACRKRLNEERRQASQQATEHSGFPIY